MIPMPEAVPRDTDSLRVLTACLATGITVVSANGEGPAGCTANSVTVVSAQPPSLLVSLRCTSRTLAAITGTGLFAINVLSWDQRELGRHFATAPVQRRFETVPHDLRLGVPILHDAVASILCCVDRTFNLDDHILVVGTPIWHAVRDEADAVVFFRQTYHRLSRSSA